jgi:hypothetical protein
MVSVTEIIADSSVKMNIGQAWDGIETCSVDDGLIGCGGGETVAFYADIFCHKGAILFENTCVFDDHIGLYPFYIMILGAKSILPPIDAATIRSRLFA